MNSFISLSPVSKETLIDFSVIPAGITLLGSKMVCTLSTPALATYGVVNATATSVANYLSSEQSLAQKVAMTAGALTLGTLVMPALSRWTGLVVSLREALLITGMAAVFKTISYALSNIQWVREVKILEDALALYGFQLSFFHRHYKENLASFHALDLRTQVVLNGRFESKELEQLPLKGSADLKDFTREELLSLAFSTDFSSLSQENRQKYVQAFYQNDIYVKEYAFSREDLALIQRLDQGDDQNLSPEKLAWIGKCRHFQEVAVKKVMESLKTQMKQKVEAFREQTNRDVKKIGVFSSLTGAAFGVLATLAYNYFTQA